MAGHEPVEDGDELAEHEVDDGQADARAGRGDEGYGLEGDVEGLGVGEDALVREEKWILAWDVNQT